MFCCVNSLWSVYDDLWSLALGWAVVVGSMNFRWNILIHCDFNRLLIQQIIKLVSSTLQIQHLYERIFILPQTVTTDFNWLIWMILVLEKCILSVYPPLLHHSQQELGTWNKLATWEQGKYWMSAKMFCSSNWRSLMQILHSDEPLKQWTQNISFSYNKTLLKHRIITLANSPLFSVVFILNNVDTIAG